MRPPTRNQTKELIRYMYPITLWSVVVTHETSLFPLIISLALFLYVLVFVLRDGAVTEVRVLIRVQIHVGRTGIALRSQRGNVLVIFVLLYNLYFKEHVSVIFTIELCTLTGEGSGLGRGESHVVGLPRDDVLLVEELDNPE